MSTAHDQLLAIARDASARYSATDLARGYGSVTRRVRRDRTVRVGVTTLAGVGVVGAGTFGILHLRGADAPVLPASPSPTVTGSVEPSPSPSPSTSPSQVTAPDAEAQLEVRVDEGARIEDVVAALASATGATEEQARAAIDAALPPEAEGEPEGWVVGDVTYAGGDPSDLNEAAQAMATSAARLMEEGGISGETWLPGGVPRDRWKDTVTIATIVGAEVDSGDLESMRGVAAVIRNRLAADMFLEVAAPLDYDVRADERTVSDDGFDPESDYNTYFIKGLPPTPIWSTGFDAFHAAIDPADEDWLYYEADEETGEIRFASTFEEHVANLVDMGLMTQQDADAALSD